MDNGGKDHVFVQELDRQTDGMLMQLATASFKPDLIISGSRSGSVLGRILAHKTGAGFLGCPLSYEGIQEKVFPRGNLLFVDDSQGGNIQSMVETVRVVKPEIDVDSLIESFFLGVRDYIKDASDKEPPGLSYIRKWAFFREILRKTVSVKTAEETFDALLDSMKKAPAEAVDLDGYIAAAKKNKRTDVPLDLFVQMLEGNLLSREHKIKAFRNLGVYFINWPDEFSRLRWAARNTRDAAFYFIKRSDMPWADSVSDEIKKQYAGCSKLPKFFTASPFNEQIDGINDPETTKVDTVYEFMVIDESRTVPESFLSWCEEKGLRFYRKTNTEGSLILETTRIRAELEYSIKNHKDFYIMEFRTSGVLPVRNFEGCARDGACKIKTEERDDRECLLCNNFKAVFSTLFGAERPGFFQWLDQKGLVTNIEYWVFLDGIKEETLSKVDLYELMKKFHEW